MAEITQQDRDVFNNICGAFDDMDYSYEKNEEDLSVTCTARGDDLPLEVHIFVHPEAKVVLLASPLPFEVSESSRIDMAVAAAATTFKLISGSFDFDLKDGHLYFRMTNSYRGSTISRKLFMDMFLVSCFTIDKYNEKLFMLSQGMLSLDKYLDTIND